MSIIWSNFLSSFTYIQSMFSQVRYFVKLLDDSDVDVRVTAGQNIALVTSLLNSNLIDQQDNDLRKQLKHYTDVEKLLDRLYDIRHDRRKSVFSQKEKKSMRQDLKEVVEIIEVRISNSLFQLLLSNIVVILLLTTFNMQTGKEPTEVLTIKHQKFTFETWPTLRQLDHFRSALAQGTHIHFEVRIYTAKRLQILKIQHPIGISSTRSAKIGIIA